MNHPKKKFFMLRFTVCGILGVILVRYLVLEPIDAMAFEMFFKEIFKGRMGFDLLEVLTSHTFLKSLGGFLAAGFAGSFIISRFFASKQASNPAE